jgi:hypothetical protein
MGEIPLKLPSIRPLPPFVRLAAFDSLGALPPFPGSYRSRTPSQNRPFVERFPEADIRTSTVGGGFVRTAVNVQIVAKVSFGVVVWS